ncbi:nucleotide disphospho-sugar-binding domain-containing protein [Nocardiopsis mangrovi]|uniref:Nucleotide disphospho-sugar-binding domain-containing protein n=1 Tax=Nocardiopsis mangrovi TaxID=1179818 RepID=A0ABV9DPX7_9ACTN
MRILFIPGNSPSPIFSHASLAHAARSCGHEVIVGGIEWVLPDIAAIGLPAVKIADVTEADAAEFMGSAPPDPAEQAAAVGRIYSQIALQSQEPLLRMAERWRPDLIVGGSMFYAAPLLAHRLGVPAVRLEWDRVDAAMYAPGAREVLAPALAERGLDALPDPALWIDICPPGLREPGQDRGRRPMRWLPVNPQRTLEPWMYGKGDRPRVYITAGARLFGGEPLSHMARAVADLGVEVVIGAPERVAADLRAELPGIDIGWVPLDVLAPTCDLILHHGGGVTDMTALHFGVPQLIVNQDISGDAMGRLADYGAAMMLEPGRHGAADIAKACGRMLGDPRFRERAGTLAAEMAALPSPVEVVGLLEGLAGG